VSELDRFHRGLLAQPDTLLALRYLERIVSRLCREHHLQLVLVLDEFEELWQSLEPRLFQNLRYLRDEFKYHLVFLTITRERLAPARRRARDDAAEVEAFWEMFDPHVFGLGMYEAEDATEMMVRIERRQGQPHDAAHHQALINLSGGHPALLRVLAWGLSHASLAHHDGHSLTAMPSVANECAKLWADLLPAEQQLVRQIALGREAGVDPDEPVLRELCLKGLVQPSDQLRLFAPIFTAYVQSQTDPATVGVVVDLPQRLVLVDGRPLSGTLSPLEFNLLAYLAQRAGQICRRDEILAALYPDEHLAVNDERIDTLLRRLREALGEDGRKPRYLFTHRGVGLRLACGGLRA
jgi:DNA-binding winged helix-turn-helix (wHTH) protein